MLNKKDNINNKITIKAALITTPPVATKGSFLVKNKKSAISGISAVVRNKIKTLYLPSENLYDTAWIENDIKNNIEFVPINNYKEIYDKLFK